MVRPKQTKHDLKMLFPTKDLFPHSEEFFAFSWLNAFQLLTVGKFSDGNCFLLITQNLKFLNRRG